MISNTNTCTESCSNIAQYKYEYNGKCYENCSYYYYNDNENNYYCTNDLTCPKEYPNLSENKKECFKYDFKNIMKNLFKEGNEIEKISKEEEIKLYDNLLQIIEKGFTSENYDTSYIDNGEDEVIKAEKMTIILTTIQNQKNNINENMSIIDLGECETLLRNHYNISNNETLYMKKIDIVQEGMKTVKVEYDVYCKFSGNNLVKLNLSVCANTKISISIPIIITDSLDKFNASSGYYNDICYTTTSEDETDISLNDRKTEFIDKDYVVCQEDCEFSEYDYEIFKAKCSCDIKETPPSIASMKINKTKLLDNFKDIKNILNFEFLICYKKLFKKEGILNNVGCYLLIAINLFHIISIFIFYNKQFPSLKKIIKKISLEINEYHSGKEDKNEIKKENKIKKACITEIKEENKKGKKEELKKNLILKYNGIFIYKKRKKENIKKKINVKKRPTYFFWKKQINQKIINKKRFLKADKIKNGIKINKLIDEEINGLSYNLALKYDKRTYFDYYISLLKTKHNLIFTFCNHTDYNSGIIKLDLFFIGFSIEYTVNALFYNDDTMHKIYESKGQFDLIYQLPIIVYSYLISIIINTFLNFLALSNDIILGFKQYKSNYNIMKRIKILIQSLSIKFFFFFVISFVFLIFFWYYISIFCVIYKNTQLHLLKDTLMSVGLSLLVPFVIYLIPGMCRIPSLYNRKRKCLFYFSQILQSF